MKRRWYEKVWNEDNWGSLDWTSDGLEMVFTVGGNAYVMDTVLREPRLVAGATDSHDSGGGVHAGPGDRSDAAGHRGPGGDLPGHPRGPDQYWWQNDRIRPRDTERYAHQQGQPHGQSRTATSIAYVQDARDLVSGRPRRANPRLLYHAIAMPYYEWSPDSRWLAASFKDSFDNWDVWILAADGRARRSMCRGIPITMGLQPGRRTAGCWPLSANGRSTRKLDLFYLYLRQEDARCIAPGIAPGRGRGEDPERNAREPPPRPPDGVRRRRERRPRRRAPRPDAEGEEPTRRPKRGRGGSRGGPDRFRWVADRVRRIKVSGSRETAPFWSHDSKALAFNSTIDGRKGTYKVVFPDKLKPEFMDARTGTQARWIKDGSKILWLSDGVPHAYTEGYPFKVYQETDLVAYRRLGFRLIWRNLKDSFYDDGFNGRDWDAMLTQVRRPSPPPPRTPPDFERVVPDAPGRTECVPYLVQARRKICGDPWRVPQNWTVRTAHLGVHLDPAHAGPGWRVLRRDPPWAGRPRAKPAPARRRDHPHRWPGARARGPPRRLPQPSIWIG